MTPFEHLKHDYVGKKVLIFGLGIQGRGIGDAVVFSQLGASVRITDSKTSEELQMAISALEGTDIEGWTLGKHIPEDIEWADVIIRNASVPWEHQLLQYARKLHKPIKMDAALFFEYAKPKKVIGITGTRGKSTTTHLIHKILLKSKKTAILGGNCIPIASLNLLKDFNPDNWYVFELSSWQLQAFHQEKISPHIGVLTNLYPDHLGDRSFEQYMQDKLSIFYYQHASDVFIVNANNKHISKLDLKPRGKCLRFSSTDVPSSWKVNLVGEHNKENIAVALKVAEVLAIDLSLVEQVVREFTTLPYRLEPIAELHGVNFINDSTSTTPIAAIKALTSYPHSIVIIGGNTKHLPTGEFARQLNSKAKKIILLQGTGTDELKPDLNPDLILGEYNDFKVAMQKVFNSVSRGDTVLFSPGFVSFGMFKNEFDRGEQFNRLVAQYGTKKT